MRVQVEVQAALTFEDRELYTQHLRVINKIVCSYSRLDAFTAAVSEIIGANKYSVTAHSFCPHNTVFVYDEEGFMNSYTIDEGVTCE